MGGKKGSKSRNILTEGNIVGSRTSGSHLFWWSQNYWIEFIKTFEMVLSTNKPDKKIVNYIHDT